MCLFLWLWVEGHAERYVHFYSYGLARSESKFFFLSYEHIIVNMEKIRGHAGCVSGAGFVCSRFIEDKCVVEANCILLLTWQWFRVMGIKRQEKYKIQLFSIT